nr:TetR/AcrR family transcriptional regulator [Haloarcula sp. CBA1122]
MTNEISFFQNPDGTREEILEATFYALRQHGYADLTISKIGDEFGKSQSLIYHHYDNKDELLVDLLDYMLEQVENQVPLPNQSPEEYIEIIVDEIFGTSSNSDVEFSQAVIELRAQAAHDDDYNRLFRRVMTLFENKSPVSSGRVLMQAHLMSKTHLRQPRCSTRF